MSRRLSMLAAVVLPLSVLALAAVWLAAPEPFEWGEDALAYRERAAAQGEQPGLLLIGNSTVGAGLDPSVLAAGLDTTVAKAHIDATSASTWYLALKNHVFGAGVRPQVVVVGSFASAMLQLRPGGAAEREAQAALSGEVEPVLAMRSYGRSWQPAFVMRADRRRQAARAAVVAGTRVQAASLVGVSDVDGAMDAVFGGEGKLDDRLHRAAVPIVDVRDDQEARRRKRAAAEDSYVRDILELCAEHGARVVFVRMPLRPGGARGVNTADELTGLLSLLNEHGAGWVDLTEEGLTERHFKDALHANARGKAELSMVLTARLAELDVLGEGPLRSAWVVQAEDLVRTGTPPALSAPELSPTKKACLWKGKARLPDTLGPVGRLAWMGLGEISPVRVTADGQPLAATGRGQGCSGVFDFRDGLVVRAPAEGPMAFGMEWIDEVQVQDEAGRSHTWLLPGTTLSLTLRGAGGGEEVGLVAEALPLQAVDDPGLTLRVDGEEVGEVERRGHRVVIHTPLSGTGEAGAVEGRRISLQLAPDAPPMLLEGLALQAAGERVYALGAPANVRPGRLGLLGAPNDPADFATPPPRITGVTREARENGELWLTLPEALEPLGRKPARDILVQGTPPVVELLVDGAPVEQRPVACDELRGDRPEDARDLEGALRWCHQGRALRVRGHIDIERLSAGLVDTRGRVGRVLYPGDVATLRGSQKARPAIRAGAAGIVLDIVPLPHLVPGADPSPLPGTVKVRVERGRNVLLDTTLPVDALSTGRVPLPFTAQVDPFASPRVALSVSADAPHLVVRSVTLVEEIETVPSVAEGG